MALISKKELKTLKNMDLVAKVTFIFAIKPRMNAENMNSEFEDEDALISELTGLIDGDGKVLPEGVQKRISDFVENKTISPTEARRLREILLS